MGLFSKLFRKKYISEKEKTTSININSTQDMSNENEINIKISTPKYNYVSVYDRKNRYQLMDNENVINDNGEAEKFEIGLLDKINDDSKPICPYCKSSLSKWPLRKIKCKSCGQYIYVKSSYIVKDKKIPLTLEQKERLEEYRSNFSYLKQLSKSLYNYGLTREVFLKERQNTNTKFSDIDVLWGILNKLSILEFNNLNLGIHSNIHRIMADILLRENKLTQSLEELMYVAFLDVNGSMNSAQNLKDAFNLETGFIAPGIKNKIFDIGKNSALDNNQLREIFINICKKRCNFTTPLSPEKAWNKVLNSK